MPCKPSKQALPLTLAVGVSAFSAHAIEPANVQLGPVYVAPTLAVETRYVDNLLRATLDAQDISTWVLDTRPKVQAWLQNGTNTYSLSYQLKDLRHSSSKDDDFTDHQVNLDISHAFNARNSLKLYGLYYDGHEERGTGLAEGALSGGIPEPVELEKTRYGGDYTYGSRESRGRLVLGYDYYEPDYQNYRAFTRFRDYEQDTYKGTFYWAVAPRTDLLAELRYLDTDYDRDRPADNFGSYDSEEYSYFVGASWEATAKTAGSVRVGAYDREFDAADRTEENGFSWEVHVDYKPRSYSVINLGTRRFSQETNGVGDFIDTEEYTLSWAHDWSARSTTLLKVLYADDEYQSDAEALFRQDDRWFGQASYSFKFRRWFDVGAGYRYEERDSSRANLDYTQHVYFIEAELSL